MLKGKLNKLFYHFKYYFLIKLKIMSYSYLISEKKYSTIPRNKNPYLPPLPFKRPNYHYKSPNINIINNNYVKTPQGMIRSYSASNIGFKDNLYHTKIQQNYIKNILLPQLNNLNNEKMRNNSNYQKTLNNYDEDEMYEIKKNQELKQINNKILEMQLSQKRIYSAEKKRNKIKSLYETNKNMEQYHNMLVNDKINKRRVKQIYSMELEHQIISVLQNKMNNYDEMSNRSRIKNKLLLDSYINSYNNNSMNNV